MSNWLISAPTTQNISQYLVTVNNDVDMPSVPQDLGGGSKRLHFNLDAYSPGTISATAKACNINGCSANAPVIGPLELEVPIPGPPTDLEIETD